MEVIVEISPTGEDGRVKRDVARGAPQDDPVPSAVVEERAPTGHECRPLVNAGAVTRILAGGRPVASQLGPALDQEDGRRVRAACIALTRVRASLDNETPRRTVPAKTSEAGRRADGQRPGGLATHVSPRVPAATPIRDADGARKAAARTDAGHDGLTLPSGSAPALDRLLAARPGADPLPLYPTRRPSRRGRVLFLSSFHPFVVTSRLGFNPIGSPSVNRRRTT